MDVFERINNLSKIYERGMGEKKALINQAQKKEEEIEKVKKESETIILKKTLLQKASEKARNNGKQVLSETSTRAVQMVMDDNRTVEIEMDEKGGQPDARIYVEKHGSDGKIIRTDPSTSDGGGIADITAMSTFFALGMLVGENNKAAYLLDEPTKYVSAGYSENVSRFISEMVELQGKQAIVVTHDKTLANVGDKVFTVDMDEDYVSFVKESTPV